MEDPDGLRRNSRARVISLVHSGSELRAPAIDASGKPTENTEVDGTLSLQSIYVLSLY